jgi:enoyl-CoA hydratase/carnithine racemase
VNKVVPAGALADTVGKMARNMAGNAPLSLLGMKLVVNQAVRDPGDRDLAAVDAAIATCFDSADYREGRTAFMEKRKPVFQGR